MCTMKASAVRALLLCTILASLNHGVFSAVMLEPVSSLYLPGSYDGNDGIVCLDQSAAEKFDYSADTQTVYVIGSEVFHTVSVEDATNPEILSVLELPGEGTDVAVCGGYVAFAYTNDDALEPGTVVIMPELSEDLSEAVNITVGPVPDQVTFTPDCSKLLVANEAEADAVDNYVVDPEGSVSIIDVAMLFGDNPPVDSQDAHTMVDFRAFNDQVDELVAQGVRYVYKGEAAAPDAEPHTLAQDLEPEYVAVSSDGTTAYVALQENNAIAVIDIEAATVTGIYGLGMKRYSDINAVIDTSDMDGIRFASWPVFGMFQPDAITYFESNGRAYLATANEGDAKEYFGDDGLLWTEEATGEDLDDLLDTDDEDLLAAVVDENLLGRLTVSLVDGVLERNENGSTASLDGVYTYGGRSFSIIDVETMTVVFDSADDLELRHKAYLPRIFNTNGPEGDFCPFDEDFADLGDTPEAIAEALLETAEADEEAEIPEDLTLTAADNLDNRSDNKGPEPESVAIGEMDGMTLLFVGNERTSTIAVYDITDPLAPVFQSLFSMPIEGSFWERYNERRLGDVDPEYLKFVSADESPTGEALLIVSGSVSGTLSMYRVANMVPQAATSSPDTAELATMATYACEPSSAAGGELLQIYPLDAAITLEALNPEATFPRLSNGVITTALADGSEVTVFDNNEQGMLAGEECTNRSPQEGCIDFPAMFSGLSLDMPTGISLPGSSSDVLQFIGLTDRGLNQDCGDLAALGFNTSADSGKAFPGAEFSPTFAQINIDTASGVVSVAGTGVCHLKDSAGVPATGVSNGENDDTPFNTDCQSRLAYNPNGVDAEDMHRIGNSDMCLMVEEYSSSVLIIDCNFADADACGTVMMRYTPEGVTLDGATYPVSDILPAEIAQRRKNRGFENAAVSPDGTRAYVLVQSPMLGNDSNLWIRVLEMDITDPLEASVTGQYMYMGDSEELWTEAAFKPKDVKLSAATWIGGEDSTTIMVLERAKKQVKLYTIDFSGADNILGTPEAASLAYENFEADAVPGEKTLILDTAQVEGWDSSIHSDKQEGVAIINPCVVAMGADNDFGLGNSGRSEMYVVQLGSCLSGECPAQATAGRKLL